MCTKLDSSLGSLDWLVVKDKCVGDSSVQSKDPCSSNSAQINQTPKTIVAKIKNPEDEKPNLSYADLIKAAIETSAEKRMTLNEIYKWITDTYSYYRNLTGTSWKNSIRHNLSLNKMFLKIDRGRGEPGKGSFWQIDMNNAGDGWYKAFRKPKVKPYCDDARCTKLRHVCRSNDPGFPRINPAIKALFSPQDNIAATSSSEVHQNLVNQIQADDVTSTNSDANNLSWNSSCSSIPPNFLLPDLENSAGSIHSHLSDSFKNLYQSVFTASFNGQNVLQLAQEPGPSQAEDTLNISQKNVLSKSQDMVIPDWFSLKHQLQAIGNGQESGLNQSIDMPSIDMRNFHSMIGSLHEQDLKLWLAQCNPDSLAASFKGYLYQNCSEGEACARLHPDTRETAITPPALQNVSSEFQDSSPTPQTHPFALQSSSPTYNGGQTDTNPFGTDFSASFDHILESKLSGDGERNQPHQSNPMMTKTDPVLGSLHSKQTADHSDEDEFDWEALIN